MNEDLTRTLREHADEVHDVALTLDDVRGRARSIRWRRTAGAVAAVAVVAAVAAPVALLSGPDSDSPDPAPSPTPTRAVDPNQRDVLFLQDGVLTLQDGPWLPLPGDLRDTAESFAVLGTDRFVVVSPASDGFQEGTLIDDHGAVLRQFPIYSGITAARDGSGVAWIAPDRSVHLLVAGSDEIRTLAVDGVRPDQPILAAAIGGDCTLTCTVVVRISAPGDLGASVLVSSTGGTTTGPVDVPAVVDLSPGGMLIAGYDRVTEGRLHACGGVFDTGPDAFLWRTCADTLRFSPDGGLVATTSFESADGPTYLEIRDARGGADIYRTRTSSIPSFVWEDGTHLLAVEVAGDGSTSIVRISTDGHTETVVDGLQAERSGLDPGIILPSQ